METIKNSLYSCIEDFNKQLKKRSYNFKETKGLLYNNIRRKLKLTTSAFRIKHLNINIKHGVADKIWFNPVNFFDPHPFEGIIIECGNAKTKTMLEIKEIVNSIK